MSNFSFPTTNVTTVTNVTSVVGITSTSSVIDITLTTFPVDNFSNHGSLNISRRPSVIPYGLSGIQPSCAFEPRRCSRTMRRPTSFSCFAEEQSIPVFPFGGRDTRYRSPASENQRIPFFPRARRYQPSSEDQSIPVFPPGGRNTCFSCFAQNQSIPVSPPYVRYHGSHSSDDQGIRVFSNGETPSRCRSTGFGERDTCFSRFAQEQSIPVFPSRGRDTCNCTRPEPRGPWRTNSTTPTTSSQDDVNGIEVDINEVMENPESLSQYPEYLQDFIRQLISSLENYGVVREQEIARNESTEAPASPPVAPASPPVAPASPSELFSDIRNMDYRDVMALESIAPGSIDRFMNSESESDLESRSR